ncbi:MAG: DUF433 domain-containing protein [Chloroflexota bacterium]|nr:DUF433 domain-containing protein [Chloroflexota bacterium]
MAAPNITSYPHIVRNPDILAGEPTIVGTRITVRNIVEAARDTQSVEDLHADYPTVTQEAIEEALAFYEAHRGEIDVYIAENEAAMTSDIW